MSAGQSLRRGYAYPPSTINAKSESDRRTEEFVLVIIAATVILLAIAALSDPAVAAAFGRMIGTAWTDAVALMIRR
jgi:hypothetical protein